MSDSNDNNNSDAASRVEEVLTTIRNALTADAPPESRATAASACRAILGVLDPATPSKSPSSAAPPTSTASAVTSPLVSALDALGQIPREQVLGFLVGGIRSLLSQSGPAYLLAPARVFEPPVESRQSAAPTRAPGMMNRKRGDTR